MSDGKEVQDNQPNIETSLTQVQDLLTNLLQTLGLLQVDDVVESVCNLLEVMERHKQADRNFITHKFTRKLG